MATITYNQTIGNKPATRDSNYITLGTNDAMRTCTFNKNTKPFWIRELGAILGRAGSTGCDYRLVSYICTEGGTPRDRAGYVGIRTVNTVMTDKDGGTSVQYQISVSDTGPHASKGVLIPADIYWALGYELDAGGPMGHGYAPDTDQMDNRSFYDITGVNIPPVSYPSTYNRYVKGHMSVWAYGDWNEIPMAPVNRSPSTGTITTLTPTFSSTFRDLNGRYRASTDAGDVITKGQIELRNETTGAIQWNPTWNATQADKDSDSISITYSGPALVRGTSYSWRIRHMDSALEWGEWSGWITISISLDSYVTLTGPTGKLNTLTPAITGNWVSLSSLAAKNVQVLVKENNVVIADSGTKAFSVAAGANFSLPWATTGLPSLDWGHKYVLNVRMQDTANNWSAYGTLAQFSTNAAPNIPGSLEPNAATTVSVVTVAPVLSCRASDPDADNPDSSLTVKARIYDAATLAQVGSTLTMTYNVATGRFEVASGLSIRKSYYFVCYSYDGWLYSGGTTIEANAAVSSAAYFDFLTGPVVTITSPANASTVTSNVTPLVWTCPTQTRFEVSLYINGKNASGTQAIVGTALTWTPPALAKTGQTMAYHLRCYDGANLYMEAVTTVTLSYPPGPALTNVSATPYTIPGDSQATAVWLSWDQTTDPAFKAYLIYRDGEDVPMARIESVALTVCVDYTAVSGQTHSYAVYSLTAVGNDTRVNTPVTVTASVTFSGIVLYDEADPEGTRLTSQAWDERSAQIEGGDLALKTWTNPAPITVRDQGVWLTGKVTIPLWDDAQSLGRVKRDKLLVLAQNGGPHIFKSGYGIVRRVSIPAAAGFSFTDERQGQISASLTLRDEAPGVWPT